MTDIDAITQHGDTQGRLKRRILVIGPGAVAATVAVGVFQYPDTIAEIVGHFMLEESVVDRLRDPNAALGIDVHGRGIA